MQMKYSRDTIDELTYKDYILLIAEELNKNGFTDGEGKEYKVRTNSYGDFVSDFSRDFILSIGNKEAIDFLKGIGLLNNGRCPLTGLMLSDTTTTTYTSEYSTNINYDISTLWKKYTTPKRNWGCFVSIPVIIIGIIIGLINSYNTIVFIVIGIGLLLGIFSIMYGWCNFGYNWDMTCLSDALGMNNITLLHIIKLRKSNIDIAHQMIKMFENGIPSGDLLSYMKLDNQEKLDSTLWHS